jgi:hypothetical protein
MTCARAIITVRRTWIARCCAALLVILIVLPFTPPYSTCAIGDLIGEGTTHDGDASIGKGIEDVAVTLSIGPLASPLVIDEAAGLTVLSPVFVPLEARSLILRL